MKEVIEYNYNIKIADLCENNGVYSFLLNGTNYIFVNYPRGIDEIDDILKCLMELKSKKVLTMDIMLNKNNKVITVNDNINYCLLRVPHNYMEEVDIVEMIKINKKTILNNYQSKLYRNNWGELWSKKIDYFEYQISELGKDKIVILDSFSYYLGLAENAISLVNKTVKDTLIGEGDKITLCHRRIYSPNIILNYYNPLSYVFDLEVRDIAEYLKSTFFYGEGAYLDAITYLKSVRLTKYSYQMFMARLLYPSYYFDIYEKIMNKNMSEENLVGILKKVQDYEQFLKKIYLEILKYMLIEEINWIVKLK